MRPRHAALFLALVPGLALSLALVLEFFAARFTPRAGWLDRATAITFTDPFPHAGIERIGDRYLRTGPLVTPRPVPEQRFRRAIGLLKRVYGTAHPLPFGAFRASGEKVLGLEVAGEAGPGFGAAGPRRWTALMTFRRRGDRVFLAVVPLKVPGLRSTRYLAVRDREALRELRAFGAELAEGTD